MGQKRWADDKVSEKDSLCQDINKPLTEEWLIGWSPSKCIRCHSCRFRKSKWAYHISVRFFE
jgi:hypothetical protein